MQEWLLEHAQYALLAFAVAASISKEWRRPGLVMLGFAALYSVMGRPLFSGESIHSLFREYNSPMFMLMYVFLDMLAVMLIFEYCRPSKQNQSFTQKTWLALSGVLIAFWVAHYLNFCYTVGYAVALPTSIYNWVTIFLALTQLIIVFPGAKEGAYEAKELVNQKLAGVHYFGGGHTSALGSSSYRRSKRGKESGGSSGNPGGNSDILVDHSRHVHTGRGKT